MKPIPQATTFADDITTVCSRNLPRSKLKDIGLHDGAPNVGIAWIQQTYLDSQSELVLTSLKLACGIPHQRKKHPRRCFEVSYDNLI